MSQLLLPVAVPIKVVVLAVQPDSVLEKMEGIELKRLEIKDVNSKLKVCVMNLETHRVPITCKVYPMYSRLDKEPLFLEFHDSHLLLLRYKFEMSSLRDAVMLSVAYADEALSLQTVAYFTMRLLAAVCQI